MRDTYPCRRVSGHRANPSGAAEFVAAQIAHDLGIRPGRTSLGDVIDLCERYGAVACKARLWSRVCGLYASELPLSEGRLFCVALVSDRLSPEEQATVLLHELVHHLLYSGAYESLNRREFTMERAIFSWKGALAVERRFVEAGGRSPRRIPLQV